jgi:hypothetical protein
VGVTEKMWDGITHVIKMDAKVEGLAATVIEQQKKIEDLTGRVIRLETALEIGLSQSQKRLTDN